MSLSVSVCLGMSLSVYVSVYVSRSHITRHSLTRTTRQECLDKPHMYRMIHADGALSLLDKSIAESTAAIVEAEVPTPSPPHHLRIQSLFHFCPRVV